MDHSRRRVNARRGDGSLSQDPRRLKRWRIKSGLTLREAGQRAGLHYTTIHKLETGDRSAEVHTLAALALAYGCDDIEDLMPPLPRRRAA